MNAVTYPRLIRRVRAMLVDSVILTMAGVGSLILADALNVPGHYGNVVFALVVLWGLEPGMVAFTGGTVGHHLFGLRVVKKNGSGRIGLVAATFRVVVKATLGWLSLVSVLLTARYQAVHDLLSGSVVVINTPGRMPAYDVLLERPDDREAYVYPPLWRRVLMIALYWMLTLMALSVAVSALLSDTCAVRGRCSGGESLWQTVLGLLWLIGSGWLAVRGWQGRLAGCQRRFRDEG